MASLNIIRIILALLICFFCNLKHTGNENFISYKGTIKFKNKNLHQFWIIKTGQAVGH